MTTSRTHFRLTTAAQRRLLFETWEATGSVTQACGKAHVGRGTFYYWKPRFVAGGYRALETFAHRAPKNPRRIKIQIEEQVIAMRQAHHQWGKRRIADEELDSWDVRCATNLFHRLGIIGFTNDDMWQRLKTFADEDEKGWYVGIGTRLVEHAVA